MSAKAYHLNLLKASERVSSSPVRTRRALLKITISVLTVCRTAAAIGFMRPKTDRMMPQSTKLRPNARFWYMIALVLRDRTIRKGTRRRSLVMSAMLALLMAMSLPMAPMAMPRSPAASAGASFTPSPTTATVEVFLTSST